MGKIVVGDPHDPDTDLGPLISYAHRDKVAAMVARAAASSPAVWHRICRARSTGPP